MTTLHETLPQGFYILDKLVHFVTDLQMTHQQHVSSCVELVVYAPHVCSAYTGACLHNHRVVAAEAGTVYPHGRQTMQTSTATYRHQIPLSAHRHADILVISAVSRARGLIHPSPDLGELPQLHPGLAPEHVETQLDVHVSWKVWLHTKDGNDHHLHCKLLKSLSCTV